MKKEGGNMNFNQCIKCGKFIGFKYYEQDKIIVHFTPDNEFSPEVIECEHKDCKNI
jgi:recombinational DNA repair protein (RecF pathway)